jgi:uncharacterized RDD family membrane protein YckC
LLLFFLFWSFLSIQLGDLLESSFGVNQNLGLWVLAIASLIAFAIYTGYFVVFEALWQGQTPGKRFVKIRVIRDDGRPIGLQQATLRALLRPIDDTLFLGVFLIILTPLEKRLGDWAAGTIVIQNEASVAAANFSISDQAQSMSDNLLELANLSALLPDDFAVIREYLQRRGKMTAKAKSSLALQLAKQVKAVIALEKLPSSVTPDVFLEAVYLAYQKQSKSNNFKL